jgi:hypothetical protein
VLSVGLSVFVRHRGPACDLLFVLMAFEGLLWRSVGLATCCTLCTFALLKISSRSVQLEYVACVQITASALMSSRPAFLPLCCAANCFSQALRSFRRVSQRCSSSVMLIVGMWLFKVLVQ